MGAQQRSAPRVHLALAGWYRLAPAARTAGGRRPAAGPGVAARRLPRRRAVGALARPGRATWSTRYVATLDPADEPLGVERTVATRTESLAVSGRVDRLDRRVVDGREQVVVVDYKTGRRLLTSYDARARSRWRCTRWPRPAPCGGRAVRVELHHLPTGDVRRRTTTPTSRWTGTCAAPSPLGGEAAAADAAYRAGLTDDGADAAFPPQVSPACRWCDFLRVCPAGSASIAPAEPWAGLAEPVA